MSDIIETLKKHALKILVVVLALLFIFQPMGTTFNFDFGGEKQADRIAGTAAFTGTLRTYDPYLILPEEGVGPSVMDEIRSMEGVREVQLQSGVVVITTETRDDVYPVASSLRQKGISTLADANIVLPSVLQVNTSSGIVNASTSGIVLRLRMEPVIDSGIQVPATAVVQVSEGQVASLSQAELQSEELLISVDAAVESIEKKTYAYSIPWEERNLELADDSSYDYQRSDSILVSPPLSVGGIMVKKQLDYVVFIDSSSVIVSEDFTNRSRMIADFDGATLRFPDSKLVATEPVEDIPYDYNASYVYRVVLPDSYQNYAISDRYHNVESSKEYEEGDVFVLDATALRIGETIVAVKPT